MAETEWSTITPEKGEPQEKIEFEIEGQEEEETPSVEASAEVEAPKKPEIEIEQEEEPAVTAEASEEKEEEEKAVEGVETSGAQKRIRQLVAQKKEREAEIEKLLESNKQMQLELQQQKQEYLEAVGTNLKSSEAQINEKLVIARDSYKRAIDSGDSDLILQAQEYLNNAQQDVVRLADAKRQYEALTPAQKDAVAEQQVTQQQAAPETYNGYGLKAYQWAASNEWFNQDQILTNAALVIDAQLKEEGFDPEEDEYYQEIDRRLAENFPQKFGKATEEVVAEQPRKKSTSTASQVVAGASHTSASPSNKKVKLSQEDVRLAQKWGITLEQYAAEKLKVESAGEGEYTTINR
jgi:murein L,D-transpeptidase YcbB/YkuD